MLALVDSDPYGLKILSVYMSGSKQMSYDSASLTTSNIKWLGVLPSDLDKYNIPAACRIKMTDKDIETGKALLKEEFITQNEDWTAELKLMLRTKEKAEIRRSLPLASSTSQRSICHANSQKTTGFSVCF